MRREVSLFYRQLAMAYRAGVPLAQGLSMATGACQDRRLKAAAEDVARRVGGGNPLAPALAAHPEVFEEVEVALVAVGEANGRVDENLLLLAERIEKAHHDKQRLFLALLYPAGLFVAALFLPKLYVWFTASFGAYLASVLGTALPFAAVIGVLAGGFVFFRRSSPEAFDGALLNVPFLGSNLRKLALARFASSLALLHASGLEIVKSLRLAIRAIGNRHLEARCGPIPDLVERGSTIAEALRAAGVFPQELVGTVAIGEKAGELDRALDSFARLYQEEAERAIKALLILLPIVIYLLAAAYVAFVVISFWGSYFKQLGSL
jgi:type IV pilus assembly protein PilC